MENDFFEEDALIYPIIRDDLPERELLVSAAELKEAMQQKVREERRVPRQIVKKKPTNSAILEIDLHITELLDNTNGLSNADMLTYQLGKFREVRISTLLITDRRLSLSMEKAMEYCVRRSRRI